MAQSDFKKWYAEISNNLASRRLKPAFDMLGKIISEYGLGVYYDEYRSLEETYHFMLKYTVEGIKDPERKKIYRKLIVSVYELADKINEAVLLRISSSIEYEKKRLLKNDFIPSLPLFISEFDDFYLTDEAGGDAEASLKAAKEHQKKMMKLFHHVWLSDKFSSEDADALRSFMLSPVVLSAYKSLFVSAVMLSLQRYFDVEKLNLLFDAYDSEEAEINQRALTGLLINLYRYDSRISFYPAITGRLKILNENPGFRKNVERIIVQLIRSKETEKLQQRIRDEILPEMIKISPNLKDKINLDSLMDEGFSEDRNPDWEEIFSDSPGLMDKMQEFSELQMEGADVFLGSFALLKSFPFYSETGNWFMPFFPENPEIADIPDFGDNITKRLIDALSSAPVLCNSDKYSFCFSLQNLPRENREFMARGINAEMEQLKELQKDEELTDPDSSEDFVSNRYIQDLYRFYKLFPRRNDFDDIFNWRLDFHNKSAFGEIIKEDFEMMKNIGEYYFAKNHFEEAAEIFNFLLKKEKNGELFQKLAFSYQKLGDFENALDGYLKAELYDINKLWNLKKIAVCYRNLNQPGKALEYYRAVEAVEPDNLNTQLNIGHSLLELDEYDEALKSYFKVEYLAPGNKKVWRPIAWCSFLTGKKEQAEKYYNRLTESEPNKHDYLNMGHVQWSIGNRKSALDFYKKSISRDGFSETEFLTVFEEDLPHLVEQGVDVEDVPIMLDQLRYFIEE